MVLERAHCGERRPQIGAGGHRGVDEQRVEAQSGQAPELAGEDDAGAVGGVHVQRRRTHRFALDGRTQPHFVERVERVGNQPVAARLVARECVAVDERHAMAVARQRPRRRRARRPRANHQRIQHLAGRPD
jgi:hypothetical protein